MVTTHYAAGLWLLHHNSELTGPRRPPRSPGPQSDGLLSACDVAEREICIKDVQPTKLPQLADEIKSTWSEISEDRCVHLVGSEPRKLRQLESRARDTNVVHLAKGRKHESIETCAIERQLKAGFVSL